MNVPQGIDKLVALASLGAEWRAKVLAGPLKAAKEAELELSDSERAIVASVPREALAGMIDSFGASVPRPSGLGKLAAGAAAAALLAATLSGCGDDDLNSPGTRPDRPPPNPREVDPAPPATDGIRPDVPESKPREAEPAPPATKGMRADLPEKKKK